MDNIGSIPQLNLGKFQYIPQMPATCTGDFDNIDMMSMGSYTGAMGMNGSLFSGIGAMPFAPYNMGTGFDSTYFDNMKNYQQNWNDYYVDSQKNATK